MASSELFRMKIISKRQVTVPQRLMDRLNLKIGDELQVDVDQRNQVRLVPVKLIRSDLFTPQIQLLLEQREKELGKPGAAVEMSLNDLMKELKPKRQTAGERKQLGNTKTDSGQVHESAQTERREAVEVHLKNS